jgi:3'(2'), 5'-bisphosphate nucleotidase
MDYARLMVELRRAAILAGERIMEVYDSEDFEVRSKSDDSPVTADEAADALISAGLRAAFPDMALVTEEQADSHGPERRDLPHRRSARRHEGIRAAPRRLHREHRAGRGRRADPRRRLCPREGAPLLHRRRGGQRRGAGPHRPRDAGRVTPVSVATPDPRRCFVVASSRTAMPPPTPISASMTWPTFALAGSSLKFCLVADRRGRPLPAPRPHHGMGHRRRPRRAARRRRPVVRFDDHAPLDLRQARLRQSLLHRHAPASRCASPVPDARRLIVIPARYASTRYPGKPLVPLRGATGEARSLIERSWRAALRRVRRRPPSMSRPTTTGSPSTRGASAPRWLMTSTTCRNGTERCAAGAGPSRRRYDMVVNLQGDAPLTPALVRRGAGRRPQARQPGGAGHADPALRRRRDALGAEGRPQGRSRRRHHGRLRQ